MCIVVLKNNVVYVNEIEIPRIIACIYECKWLVFLGRNKSVKGRKGIWIKIIIIIFEGILHSLHFKLRTD